ncbi:MAG: hypothetical protein ACI9TH_002254 [Kiritimatiellia bacterium]
MSWKRGVLIGVAVIGLGITWAVLNDPTRKIHRRLEALANLAHVSGKEGPAKTLQRTTAIVGFFTESCHVDFGPMAPEITTRGELRGMIAQLRMHADTIDIKIRGKSVHLAPGKKAATVDLMLEGTLKIGSEYMNEFREYQLHMEKDGGEWFIARIDEQRSITTPDQL